MLDEFQGQATGGAPDHPHRGFETVSYLEFYRGQVFVWFSSPKHSFNVKKKMCTQGLVKNTIQWSFKKIIAYERTQ